MELTHILIFPKTGSRLRFSDGDSVVRVHRSDVTYPVVEGIVEFALIVFFTASAPCLIDIPRQASPQ